GVEQATRSRSTSTYPSPDRGGGPQNWGRIDRLRDYSSRRRSLWTEPSGSGVLSRAPLGQPRFRMLFIPFANSIKRIIPGERGVSLPSLRSRGAHAPRSPGRTIASRSRGRVGLVLLFVAGGAGKPLLTWSALPDSSRIRTQVQVVGPLLGENRP